MKAVCSWCRAEGRSGLVGERPPLEDSSEVQGVCWQHRVDWLARTRTLAGDGGTRFLVVIGRQHEALLRRVSEGFIDDPRVRVVVDRRQRERRQHSGAHAVERRRGERRQSSDYWDDIRYHAVVIVPARASEDADRAASPARATVPEARVMDDSSAEVRRRIEEWARAGQSIVNQVIPSLFHECDSLRKRAESAEARVDELQVEVDRLRAEMDRLRIETEALMGTLETGVREIGRISNDVLLKLKAR